MAAEPSVVNQTGLVQPGNDVVETRLRCSGNQLRDLVPAYMNSPGLIDNLLEVWSNYDWRAVRFGKS